jgi:hypothetical protein
MSEYPVNLKKGTHQDKVGEKEKKKSTLVESMSAWACSDMDHPVITTLKVE